MGNKSSNDERDKNALNKENDSTQGEIKQALGSRIIKEKIWAAPIREELEDPRHH